MNNQHIIQNNLNKANQLINSFAKDPKKHSNKLNFAIGFLQDIYINLVPSEDSAKVKKEECIINYENNKVKEDKAKVLGDNSEEHY